MTETQKANVYGQLLNQHTRLYNQINEIKSQDMDFKQRRQVMELEAQQHQIMRQIKKLFS
jgi:hypothetical protein